MRYCNRCGNELTGDEKYCGKCGLKLENLNPPINPITSEDLISDKIEDVYRPAGLTKPSDDTNKINEVEGEDLEYSGDDTPIINDSDGTNQITVAKRGKPNVLLICILAFLILLVGGVFGVKVFLTNKYSPEKIISKFQNAVSSNDKEALLEVLYSNSPGLTIDDTSANSIINLFSKDDAKFQDVISSLSDDVLKSSKLITKGSNILLEDDDLFALTLVDSNFFYTKYAVLVKPVSISVTTNNMKSTVSINDENALSISDNSSIETLPLLAPGIYDIKFTSTDIFNNEISDTVQVDTSIPYNSPIKGFTDYSSYIIYSNIPDSKVYVNGKDTKLTTNSTETTPILLKATDSVHLSYECNGKTYTTMAAVAGGSYSELYIEFDYYDYIEINTFIAQEKEMNSLKLIVSDYIDKYRNVDFIIPTTNSVELVFKDLNDYTIEELFLARNEMLARHGYTFDEYPKLRAYFESKSWYKPTASFSGELTKDVEKNNYDMIRVIEFLKMAKENCPKIYDNYVLPNSNTKELRSSDVRNLNDWELIVARNEIFARYGLEFSTIELLEHFKARSWFIIDSSVGNDVGLTTVERKNVEVILAEEKSRRDIALDYDLGEY